MYELLVLSLLMKFPLHAYLISKIANDTLGPWEKISRGTLSTLLNKLYKDGLIQDAAAEDIPFPTERSSRTYEITERGKTRFFELMMDTEKNAGNYPKIFHIKAIYLEFISFEDQLYLASHYMKYCEKAVEHIREQQSEFDENPDQIRPMQDTRFYRTIRELMELQIEQWELERQWASRFIEKISADFKSK